MTQKNISRGILCLTFDDANYDRWVNALPLFQKYNAHASFFPSGEFDAHALQQLSLLHQAGHAVGSHTVHHADAPQYIAEHSAEKYWDMEIQPHADALKTVGIDLKFFAYPNGVRTVESDALLLKHGIRRIRGCSDGIPEHRITFYDADGTRGAEWRPVATNDAAFLPLGKLEDTPVLYGPIIGESYHTDLQDICRAIQRAADTNSLLMTVSHDIAPDAHRIHMKTEWLETILKTALEAGVQCLSFGDLENLEMQG